MDKNDDVLMEDAILYLQKQTNRDRHSKNDKRTIRRKAERFTSKTGELLYEQVDVLPSKKNQALCDLIYNVLYNYIN